MHEAFLRLVDDKGISWESKAHFFAVAARAMRLLTGERTSWALLALLALLPAFLLALNKATRREDAEDGGER